jgi:hypothetical protein
MGLEQVWFVGATVPKSEGTTCGGRKCRGYSIRKMRGWWFLWQLLVMRMYPEVQSQAHIMMDLDEVVSDSALLIC